MKKVILQLCVSFLILSLIFVKADWNVLFAACKKINIPLFLISTGVVLINVFINSSKFHLLLKNSQLSLPVMRLVKINLIARAYAVLIPTSLGPAAVRWYKVTKNKQGKSFFLATTVIERIFFLLVMVLCGTLPLLLYTQHTQIILLRQKLFSLIIVTYGILFISLIYFLVPRIHHACMRFMATPCSAGNPNCVNKKA